jgi:hypothetical protein
LPSDLAVAPKPFGIIKSDFALDLAYIASTQGKKGAGKEAKSEAVQVGIANSEVVAQLGESHDVL